MTTKFSFDCGIGNTRWGFMLWPKHDTIVGRSLELYGEYSKVEVDLLCKVVRPGMTVVEVGGNIGALSVPIAKIIGETGRLIVFEPQYALNRILMANLAMNECFNAQVLLAAAGVGVPGERLKIPLYDYSKEDNFGAIGRDMWDKNVGMDVPVIGIDKLVELPVVHVMKIDAEGMELEVLKGANKIIRRDWPWMFVENDRQDRSVELIRHLKGLGYEVYWFVSMLYSEENFHDNKENVFGYQGSFNMVCRPPQGSMRVINIQGLNEVQEDDCTTSCPPQNLVVRI